MKSSFNISNIFMDHMVFQRGKPIRIFGEATPCSIIRGKVECFFDVCNVKSDGKWEIVFPALNEGGPYEIEISNNFDNKIVLKDVMVGEVWVCSGQSNMEYMVYNDNPFYSLYEEGKALGDTINDDKLRLLHVDRALNAHGTCDNLVYGCKWTAATSLENISKASAVGFYFGLKLREAYPDVPVGIISASWGGTMIEPWIPEKYFKDANDVRCLTKIAEAKNTTEEGSFVKISDAQKEFCKGFYDWAREFNDYDVKATADALANNPKKDVDISSWDKIDFGGFTYLKDIGISWYRKEIEIPEDWVGGDVQFFASAMSDEDEVFFDDVLIGSTTADVFEWWSVPRIYLIDKSMVTSGKHAISIRLKNHFMTGFIADDVVLSSKKNYHKIDLKEGDWYQKKEFSVVDGTLRERPSNFPIFQRPSTQAPCGMFNAMINPLTNLAIRGVLWYQGCSNREEPQYYEELNKGLIKSWRECWNDEKMPFIITQLSAFHSHNPENRLPDDFWKELEPSEDGFLKIREIQKNVTESMEDVGLVVTIDVGDHSDIHPKDKKTVAERMFATAQSFVYGDGMPLVYPDIDSVVEQDGGLLLKIKNVEGGLKLKGSQAIGEHMFELAGENGVYHWAEAKLVSSNEIFVQSKEVQNPKTVRYAWSGYPPFANIYSSNDLPLQPFRTDTQKLY